MLEELTAEEQAIIDGNEAPAQEENKQPEPEESEEQPPETELPEEVEAEEENQVPQSRFNKIYGANQELKREIEELKTQNQQFQGNREQPKQEQPAAHPQNHVDENDLQLSADDPYYPGWTIGQVRAHEDEHGGNYSETTLQNYRAEQTVKRILHQERTVSDAQAKQQEYQDSANKDLADFREARKAEDLDDQAIDKSISDTLTWMQETGRGAGNLQDAFYLKNRAEILAEEGRKANDHLIKSARKSPGVSATKGGTDNSVNVEAFGAYEMEEHVEGLSSAGFVKFMNEASPALKVKFPMYPWS